MTASSEASTASAGGTQPEAGPWARSVAGLGMIVYLASDVMLFASFFAAYFLLRSINQPWPPDDVELDVVRAGAATAVLLASSVTLEIGHRRLQARGDATALLPWVYATLGLGTLFVVNLLDEYRTLDFGAGDHPYGSIYWLLTGLHGTHVVTGLTALGMLGVRAARAHDHRAVGPWLAGTSAFWHLLDAIWLAVFTTIWVLR